MNAEVPLAQTAERQHAVNASILSKYSQLTFILNTVYSRRQALSERTNSKRKKLFDGASLEVPVLSEVAADQQKRRNTTKVKKPAEVLDFRRG